MKPTIPIYIQHAWAFYNSTEVLLTNLWESYQDDFLEHYFSEIAYPLEEPEGIEPDPADLADEDDIPF
ncbi:MAG: hypothetical protein GY807_06445 [Gammaproteobacteria bacterium]|nr:hypothetical protein [Gammaproteobacteria bacterium]